MKIPFILSIIFVVIVKSFPCHAQVQSDQLSGQYRMTTEEAMLTLDLKQQGQSGLSGTLSSSTGIQYSLQGQVEGNTAAGTCSDGTSSVYFELYAEGTELTLSLIEPDAWGNPDYNTATYLSFSKTGSTTAPSSDNKTVMNTTIEPTGNPQARPTGNEIGNPSWGFRFIPPQGWTHQQTGEGIMLGHSSIPGLILIFPHMLQTADEVSQEMMNGIREGGNYLLPSGGIQTQGNGILAGDYQGIMDGQQAKARGFGTLSPYGGGAFILAVSTPEMLGDAIKREAEWIAGNLIYTKMETSDLVAHFAGRWASFTTNTSSWIEFKPDGTYDEQYESSYSGELSGGGNWGAAGAEQAKGRWTVQGNRDQGRIVVRLNNDNEIYYDYRVHEERGEKYYGEYWFNGKLYGKSRD